MIARLLSWLGCCRHPRLYRERRELYGANILHWVCPDCSYATPLISRTEQEHVEASDAGRVLPFKVTRGEVETPMRRVK